MFKALPLLAIPLIVYNLFLFGGDVAALLATELFRFHLISGANWTVSGHDALIAASLLVLYIEIFKSTRTGMASVLDHSLSTLVFIVFVVEFLTVAGAGTSTFFIIGLMSLIDVVSGFTVSIVAARRDFAFGNGN